MISLARAAIAAAGLAAAVGFASPAWAQDIGRAVKVVNLVYRNGLSSRLQPDGTVSYNEQISTKKDSATQLLFVDNSTLSIGADADVLLDNMVFDPGGKVLGGVARISSGALRFAGGPGKKNLTFETPTSVIGIRGTQLNLLVSPASTEIEVTEGVVQITAGGITMALPAPQYAVIRPGAAPIFAPVPALFRQQIAAVDRMLGLQALAPPGGSAPAGRSEAVTQGGRSYGRLLYRADGRVDALDPTEHLRGWFDPARNVTVDPAGRVIGQGNLTRTLLGLR